MHLKFIPLRGLVVVLLFSGLTLFAVAADKKRKSAEAAKSKNKSTQKADSKRQAKATNNSRQEKRERNKSQLAKQKKEADEKDTKKRGKQSNKLAQQRQEKASDKARNKDKTAKRETEKMNDKAKNKLARREDDKKSGKKKDEVAAKKTSAEKDTKSAKAKSEEQGKATAKNEKFSGDSKPVPKSEPRPAAKAEENAKELTASKYTLRPIAKVVPKVELTFGVARSTAGASFDVPPPPDNGPDVIDVIEHDSPETQRLNELLRSEMKTLPYSGVPSVSRRKLDVGKMDAERIKQIQEALTKKGYYTGEITGQYDDATVEAMRRFQEASKIDVTGYATAQSLRLLGLTDW